MVLLDRHRQRDTLLGAKEEFYRFSTRRMHHVVALGTPGCMTHEFPAMVRRHLVDSKREQEIYLYQPVELSVRMDSSQKVDESVRRQLGLEPRESLLSTLIKQSAASASDFWFLVLGWLMKPEQNVTEDSARVLSAVADWCSQRLGDELAKFPAHTNIRVMSILAWELDSDDEAERLEPMIEELIDDYDQQQRFYFGELDRLTAVRLRDLRGYFRNEQICRCDDRYREQFPEALLAGRKEMHFQEAVATIRRGEPDNWGNLIEELTSMTKSGDWYPKPYDPHFWERRDGHR